MTLLAPRDAGRILGISSSRMAQLDREGVFPALRDSAGRRLYDADKVATFERQRRGLTASALPAGDGDVAG